MTALAACPPALADPRFAERYPALARLADLAAEQRLHLRGTRFPVYVTDAFDGPACVVLPLDRYFEVRARHALRLWRGLSRTATNDDPAALGKQTRDRLILALRALDARQSGASYREIAQVLFKRQRLGGSDWKTLHLRSKTVRLVRLGEALMQGEYRRLLLHPYRRRLAGRHARGIDLAAP